MSVIFCHFAIFLILHVLSNHNSHNAPIVSLYFKCRVILLWFYQFLKILTLVPDSWSQKYYSEYFGVSEYLIQFARELKQRKGILAQPSQKKGKAMAEETIDLVNAFYEDDEYSRQLPWKKAYVSIQKGVHKQKRLDLCNLHELFVAFKERNPDMKIGFSMFCTLCLKWCAIAGFSGTHTVYVCTTHENNILLVGALN